MNALFCILTLVLAGGVTFSARNVPTEAELRAAFEEAQKLYAAGDYGQASEKYGSVAVSRSRFLDEGRILITVGEITLPLTEAILYQMGNVHLKMAEEAVLRAGGYTATDSVGKYEGQARESAQRAATYFSDLESESEDPKVQALAENRLVTAWYQIRDYTRTIGEAKKLIERYPESEYAPEALYNLGWSYYECGDYGESIEWFDKLIEQFPSGYRSDRAYFQIGEAYLKEEQFVEAIAAYQKVVDRADVYSLTERDLVRMRREKLAGLVDETVLELAAKAQLKIGDAWAQLGSADEALRAYQLVIKFFTQDERFVEEGYLRLADMYVKQGNLEGSIAVYKAAIEQIQNRFFQARMQYLLGERYYDAGRFDEAIEEYELYEKGYGEVADQAGIPLDQIAYKIGRSLYGLAERGDSTRTLVERAVEAFDGARKRYPNSALQPALSFNAGLAEQLLPDPARQRAALGRYREVRATYPTDDYSRHALVQIARVYYHEKEYPRALEAYHEAEAEAEVSRDSLQMDIARFETGITLRDSGDWSEAVESFLRVAWTASLVSRARLEAGVLLVSNSEWEGALAGLEEGMRAAESAGVLAKFHYLRAKALAGLQRYPEAVEEYTAALGGSDSQDLKESVTFGRAMAYASMEQFDLAADDLVQVTGSSNETIRKAALRTLGGVRLRQGREEEAISYFQTLEKGTKEPDEQAEMLLLLGELYDGTGAWDRVIETTEKVLASDVPDRRIQETYYLREKAYFLLANAHSRRQEWGEAISVYKEGLSRYAGGFYGQRMEFGLGEAYFQSEQLEEAIGVLQAYVKSYPDSPNLVYGYYYLGFAYVTRAMFQEAAECLETVADRFPAVEVTPQSVFYAGESRFNLRQFDQAIERYQQVFNEYPASEVADDALYSAAWAAIDMDRKAEGAGYFEELLRRYPGSNFGPGVRLSLGDYYFNQGEYSRAKEQYLVVQQDYSGDELAKRVPELLGAVREVEAFTAYEKEAKAVHAAIASRDEQQSRETIARLQRFLEEYSGTEAATGALNNIGACYENLGEWKQAAAVYGDVVSEYERGKASSDAYLFAKEHLEWIQEAKL